MNLQIRDSLTPELRNRLPGSAAALSQKGLATFLKVSQQISRLESSGYEGHSLSTLRRVAKVLHARVRVTFEPEKKTSGMRVAEAAARYGRGRKAGGRGKV